MKSIVIYFSQTGNTEKIARSIQTGIRQVTGQCDLQEIRDANPLRLKDYDLIGFGAPVIGRVPEERPSVRASSAVRGRQARLQLLYARHHARDLLAQLSTRRSSDRGLTVIGSADWYGDCYLLHMPQPYPTAGHPDAIDLEEAEAFGGEMAVRSMRIRAGETDLIPPAPCAPCSAPVCSSGAKRRRSACGPDHSAGCSSSTRRSASTRAAHCAWTTAPCMGWTSLSIRPS